MSYISSFVSETTNENLPFGFKFKIYLKKKKKRKINH